MSFCKEDENPEFTLLEASAGDLEIPLDGAVLDGVPLDRSISLRFSEDLDPATVSGSVILNVGGQSLPININLAANRTITVQALGGLQSGQIHKVVISNSLKSASGTSFIGQTLSYKTQSGTLAI